MRFVLTNYPGYAYKMKLQPRTKFGHIAVCLYAYIAALLVGHWLTVMFTLDNPQAMASMAATWFDLDREYNVPTVTNTVLLWLSAATFIALAYKAKQRAMRTSWVAFAMLFAYLGFDELLIIHEQLAEPVRRLLNIGNSNPLYHAWVVPAFIVIIGLGCAGWWIKRYFKQLKPCSVILKLLVIMAAGVVSIEILGTFLYEYTAVYRLAVVPLEEVFELVMGSIIFLTARKQLKLKTK